MVSDQPQERHKYTTAEMLLVFRLLYQWLLILGPHILLDDTSQKSWSAQIMVKASGSFSPRTSGDSRLGTTALEQRQTILMILQTELYILGLMAIAF